MKEQRRRRKIAMTREERDSFLAEERTCRIATVSADGGPHITPLWFVWDGEQLWLSSLVRSQRWTDLRRNGRVSVVVDAGDEYASLRGVEMRGVAAAVGEIPRTGAPVSDLATPERLFAEKYTGGSMQHDGQHAWLRISPEKIVTWDFRKLSALTEVRP